MKIRYGSMEELEKARLRNSKSFEEEILLRLVLLHWRGQW